MQIKILQDQNPWTTIWGKCINKFAIPIIMGKEDKGGFEFGEGSGLGRIYKMVHRVE